MVRKGGRLVVSGVIALLLGLFLAGAASISAQQATPATGATGAPTDVPHPTHIHQGTCANLNPNPQYPLANTEYPSSTSSASPAAASPMASPAAGGMVGTTGALPAELSVTKVDVSLQDLLASPHAINVHESAANIQHYIACGDIGGIVTNGSLIFGLQQQNNSGYAGTAWLKDNGDGTTTVTVFLVKGLVSSAPASASPAASPAGTPAM